MSSGGPPSVPTGGEAELEKIFKARKKRNGEVVPEPPTGKDEEEAASPPRRAAPRTRAAASNSAGEAGEDELQRKLAARREKNREAPPSSSSPAAETSPAKAGPLHWLVSAEGEPAGATAGREVGQAGAAVAAGWVEPTGWAPDVTGGETHVGETDWVVSPLGETDWVDLGAPGDSEVRCQPQFLTVAIGGRRSGVLHVAHAVCEVMLSPVREWLFVSLR